ncbi:hypothetical protein BDD12DRAFT_910257 [Trichophaea hybrida]|nr:hypothetical protein BDD12DRAFT_910257 [Trichophaea hybrida]
MQGKIAERDRRRVETDEGKSRINTYNAFGSLAQSSTPPPPSLPRRRTSSTSSYTTVDGIVSDTTNTWHSLPLAFAVLPAVGGILFHNGSAVVTDIMLLLLVAIFLHWLIKFPWEWYHSSQSISSSSSTTTTTGAGGDPECAAALREMQRNELTALVCCFLGPVVGGWILHAVRAQLSRPSEGLVSDFNLTIFVMAAEVRPVAQVIKLVRMRAVHLQRVVAGRVPVEKVEEVEGRVEVLEQEVKEIERLAKRLVGREADLDALNRAVRRYEKKEALQSAQTETRILEMNHRLALAVAASAKQQQQQYRGDTFSAILFEYAYGMMLVPFSIAWKLVSLPVRAGRVVLKDSSSVGGVGDVRNLKKKGAATGRLKG